MAQQKAAKGAAKIKNSPGTRLARAWAKDVPHLALRIALLLLAADYLVDSSVAIAQRAHISNFVIGLTIVGMGTSAPELLVGVSSALSGHGDIAMGNVVGSNIANVFLILGLTAAIRPFDIERSISRRDIPFGIGAAVLLLLLAVWLTTP